VLLPPFVMSSVSAASPRFCIVAVALRTVAVSLGAG
jgi:hypothetical protein